MTDPDEVARALIGIGDVLDALAVRWAIGGSIASAAHGEPRATNDVDVIAVLSEADARAFVARLGKDYYADEEAAADAARRRSSFNVIDQRSFVKVDVFVPARGPMGTGQLDRSIALDVFPNARPLPILGPEDTILQKLRWYRMGGEISDRQWRDLVSVIKIAGARLDDTYLEDVAATNGMADLLRRARQDAKLP